MKKRIAFIWIILLHASQVIGQTQPSNSYALTNVTIIDGTGATASDRMTVIIEGQNIKEIFKTEERSILSNVEVVDLEGHYVVPGLINSHIHLSNLLLGRVKHDNFNLVKVLIPAGIGYTVFQHLGFRIYHYCHSP